MKHLADVCDLWTQMRPKNDTKRSLAARVTARCKRRYADALQNLCKDVEIGRCYQRGIISSSALNEVPFVRSVMRSCRKPRYGAKPVPAPIMRRGAVGSRGSRKVLWRRKIGTRVPGNFSLRKVLDSPLCRRPVHHPSCKSGPDAFLVRTRSRCKGLHNS